MSKTTDVTTLVVPFWPVVEVSLSEPATVKVHGVTAPLVGDAQAGAVAVAASLARALGRPVRMRVRSGTGVQVLVVSPLGVVSALRDDAPVERQRFRMLRRS